MAKLNFPPEGAPPALSRTALEEFIKCPRCFYLHRRKGLKQLSRIPLTLAVATDALLKNEFDTVRKSGGSHPIWVREGLDLRAYSHPDLETWRSNFKGLRVVHEPTGATIYGAVDDIWQHRESGDLHIVDYKSTSKKETPDLESGFGDSYKRQMEIYQWIYRQAGFSVSPVGYFLYVNGIKEGGFYSEGEGHMRFATTVLTHKGNTDWVNDCVGAAVACFQSDQTPDAASACDTCRYVSERSAILSQKNK
jgi:hypothetical protein